MRYMKTGRPKAVFYPTRKQNFVRKYIFVIRFERDSAKDIPQILLNNCEVRGNQRSETKIY
jgi:hypothetical protein